MKLLFSSCGSFFAYNYAEEQDNETNGKPAQKNHQGRSRGRGGRSEQTLEDHRPPRDSEHGGWKGEPTALGQMFPITVTGLAGDDKVLAVSVTLPNGPESKNANPHITVAVDYEAGGKPVMSNKLDWSQTQTLSLSLEGQLQDAKQTGSYTGLVLTEDGHNQLVNAVNLLGYTLQPNPGQTPPLAPPGPVKQESIRLLRNLIREFID